jgi:hypothetical protein
MQARWTLHPVPLAGQFAGLRFADGMVRAAIRAGELGLPDRSWQT